ncbi:4-hydroxy-3-methylbut-2-enyl diphosphate reductase [Candidatus Woesearchaeota archaeon]|nr:4-hydroxy-3-methylbut-2-enyl diphosphate reductase [Candidatus Woesearchaeota archaeon]
MKKITLAKHAGFCFGVKRALNIVTSAKNKNKTKKVNIFGPLIHNPQEIKRLEKKGIKTVYKLHKNLKDILVIRAHGVPDSLIKRAKAKGLKTIDATCPFVKQVHVISKDLEKKGHQVVVFGDAYHPEVVGIAGNLKDPIVVEEPELIEHFPFIEKMALVAQTTQNQKKFNKAAKLLKSRCNKLIAKNTICNATEQRQNASKKLAEKSDIMIVIGGQNSGNTKRLNQICKSLQKNTYHIETEKELKKQWFDNKKKIGITAGASTPDWIIRKVISRIKEI